MIITHGLSGSGKTWLTDQLVMLTDAIRLRSDIERKRLQGLAPEAQTGSRIGGDLYAREMTARTYARLRELAGTILNSGFPVIVDATFLTQSQRADFRELARRMAVPFCILDVRADEAILKIRVTGR